jgi:hypothetical protein
MHIIVNHILENSLKNVIYQKDKDLYDKIFELNDNEIILHLHAKSINDFDQYFFDDYIKEFIKNKVNSITDIYACIPSINEQSEISELMIVFTKESDMKVNKFDSINLIKVEFDNILKDILLNQDIIKDKNLIPEDYDYIFDSLEHLVNTEKNKILISETINKCKIAFKDKNEILPIIKDLNVNFIKNIL